MHLNTSELLKKYILKVLFVMPKFNPIFTFSKIYLKLTKKSSYFCIFKLFHKKYLNFICKRQVICWIENHFKKIDNYIEN